MPSRSARASPTPKRRTPSPTPRRRTPSPTPKRRLASPKRATTRASAAPAAAAVKPVHYEFGGPLGAFGIMAGLPAVVLGLYFGCGKHGCVTIGPSAADALRIALAEAQSARLWSWEAAAVVLGWIVFQAAMYVFLPGEMAEGVRLRNGVRLTYPMNGHLAFWLSLAPCHALPPLGCSLSWLYDHYVELACASIVLSFILSAYSFLTSFRSGCMLADGGNTGNRLYDFYIGRPLNPRIGPLDLKAFCELRPGLIGWLMLNMGMARKQYELTGSVSAPMLCVNAFQALYVWDALHYERAILTTMDITTDGFGFMLAFGDLSWVPFTYSLQARLLVDLSPGLSAASLAAICCLNMLGYAIFRGANSQKDAFRRDPDGATVSHLKWMPTARGTKLLISGWWGMARKINYSGDWLMGLSWSLCCGTISPIAYFYAIYFAVLLVHRAMRDDHFCSLKYGKDWQTYKRHVPAIFVPGCF